MHEQRILVRGVDLARDPWRHVVLDPARLEQLVVDHRRVRQIQHVHGIHARLLLGLQSRDLLDRAHVEADQVDARIGGFEGFLDAGDPARQREDRHAAFLKRLGDELLARHGVEILGRRTACRQQHRRQQQRPRQLR